MEVNKRTKSYLSSEPGLKKVSLEGTPILHLLRLSTEVYKEELFYYEASSAGLRANLGF